PYIRFGAALAFVECQRCTEALRYLEPLRCERADFRPDAVSLLIARSYAGTSRVAGARAEFESAVVKFATYEAKAEYAIWAYAISDATTAQKLSTELEKISARWNAIARELNEPVVRRLAAARALASRRT
ncbi:MAG: hypothetical protein WCH44_09820, partial [Betaproteobacteria bacterium]